MTTINEMDTNNEIDTINLFKEIKKEFYANVDRDFKKYLESPTKNLLKCIYDKYPHLKKGSKLTKRTKKVEAKALVHEILERQEYSAKINRNQKKIIYKMLNNKYPQSVFDL
jgi:hypothetical protein